MLEGARWGNTRNKSFWWNDFMQTSSPPRSMLLCVQCSADLPSRLPPHAGSWAPGAVAKGSLGMSYGCLQTFHIHWEFIPILFFSNDAWLIYNVVLISAVQQGDSVIHVYIHFLKKYSFPLWFIIGYWTQFLVLYSRTLLFLHCIYNRLHLLIPTSHSIPPPNPSLLATTSLFSVSLSLFLFPR